MMRKCVYCGCQDVIKKGFNKKRDKRRYLCKCCGRKFSIPVQKNSQNKKPTKVQKTQNRVNRTKTVKSKISEEDIRPIVEKIVREETEKLHKKLNATTMLMLILMYRMIPQVNNYIDEYIEKHKNDRMYKYVIERMKRTITANSVLIDALHDIIHKYFIKVYC